MPEIEFAQLSEIPEDDLVTLMTNEDVGRQMPLLAGGFSAQMCKASLADVG